MKKLIIILSFLAITLPSIAGKPADRHFYVTFTYTDSCGMLRVGSIGWSGKNAYPRTTDLVLRAADVCGAKLNTIQITGISAICASDYNNLFNIK